jgi:DNA-binding transcriptional MerR regulator
MNGDMTIGELARQAGVTRKSVLVYERDGLLGPAGRTPAGYRLYGGDHLVALAAIRDARQAGFGVAEIGAVMAACRQRGCADARATADALRHATLERLDREIAELQARRARLAEAAIGVNCLPAPPGASAKCCPNCGQVTA